jgi:hypothetical protein
MWQSHLLNLVCVLAVGIGGCSTASPPVLPSTSVPLETGAVSPVLTGQALVESSTVVPGTPVEVYSLVARGALRCWFGADGPLKTTHIFHADAPSPGQRGATEIVLHEREGDQRGSRAFRVSFEGDGGSVRVASTSMKIQPPLAEPMARDVEAWAKGEAGCQLRPPKPPPAASAPQAAKKRSAGGQQR